jgi:uncharacterized protein (TIGR04255 family)
MRFNIPDKLHVAHIGFLWDKFRSEYPVIQHVPPIATAKGAIPVDGPSGMPLPRVWFINESDDQLVQFQFDRIYFNWRRRQDVYPRYPHVIENFESAVDNVVKFFGEFELGELKPVECELSYINHIPEGQEWSTTDDLSKIFSDFVWKQTPGRFLPNPENAAWQTNFPLPETQGRLAVKLKQAIRTEDEVPLLVLELTARGLGKSTDENAVREWFDLAHEWIVRGFTDLTTPEIQKIWEREQNG